MKESDVRVDGKKVNKKSYPWAFATSMAFLSAGEQYSKNVDAICKEAGLDKTTVTHKELIPAIRDKVRQDYLNMGVWPLSDAGKPIGKEKELRKYGCGKAWLAHATWLRSHYPTSDKDSKPKSALDQFRTAFKTFTAKATPSEWNTARKEGLVPDLPKTKIRKQSDK